LENKMPRDLSGNYTLPGGNPVVGGTIIDVAWANPTMEDIAVQLNNVFTRDGLLGPLAPWKLTDGVQAAPSLTFNSELGLGLFRESQGVLGVATENIVVARFKPTGLQLSHPLNLDRLLLADGTVAAPSLTFADDLNTGIFSSAAGNLNVSILGVGRAVFSASGLNVNGDITGSVFKGSRLELTGDIVTDGTVSAGGMVATTTLQARTNASIANLFIGYPVAAGLMYRSDVDTVILRTGDGPTNFANYFFNLTQFVAPDLVHCKHLIAQGGVGSYNPPADPNACALRLDGDYGGGMLFNAGVNGFASMYIVGGGHVRLRTYSVSPALDHIHQFNSDGSVYSKVFYGYTDATHFTYHGWDGANATAAYMRHLTYIAHIYLNNIGQIVFTQFAGAVGGIAMTIDGAGVAIAGTLHLKGRPITHTECSVAVTDGNGNATVAFAATFAGIPAVICTGDSAAKIICTVNNRTVNGFSIKTCNDAGQDVAAVFSWIAMQGTQ
jgi:hypothetical protein